MSTRVENRKLVTRAGIKQEHPIDTADIADTLVQASTNGTTAVNVFGSKGAPFDLIITGFFVGAKDTTAGNITLANAGATVAQVAKGTTAGVMVFEDTALANTTVRAGAAVTIVSSSAGNTQAFITYRPA